MLWGVCHISNKLKVRNLSWLIHFLIYDQSRRSEAIRIKFYLYSAIKFFLSEFVVFQHNEIGFIP